MKFERKHAVLLLAVAVWNVVTFGTFAKNLWAAYESGEDRATGYWTTRSDRDPGLNARTAGVYLRADPSDLQVLDSGSEEGRARLIAQRLREWKSAANAF